MSDTAREAFFRAMLNGDECIDEGCRGQWVFGYLEVGESDLDRLTDTYADVAAVYGRPDPDDLVGVWFLQLTPAGDLHVSACEDLDDAETWFDEEMSGVVR